MGTHIGGGLSKRRSFEMFGLVSNWSRQIYIHKVSRKAKGIEFD